MKPLIGTITAGIALSDITEAVAMIEDKCEIVYLSYRNYDEVKDVISNNIKKLDGIMYGGYRSYIAAPVEQDTIPFEVLNIGAADIYELFLRIIVVDKIDISKVSIDFLDKEMLANELSPILGEKKLPFIYTPKGDNLNLDEILKHHVDLYDNGKVECIVTTLPSIAAALKEYGIKYYYIQPSIKTIAEALGNITNKALTEAVNGGLTVVGVISPVKASDTARLHQIISEFTAIHGTHFVSSRNKDNCHIVTQNRFFTNFTKNYTTDPLIDYLEDKHLPSHIGWGIGAGVGSASDNAMISLEQASSMKPTTSSSYITTQEGKVVGAIGDEFSFSYSRENTTFLQKISETTGLSVMYIQKIIGISDMVGDMLIDCEIIGNYLGISKRSANRVINRLLISGYAVLEKQETTCTRGRPIKKYLLKLS